MIKKRGDTMPSRGSGTVRVPVGRPAYRSILLAFSFVTLRLFGQEGETFASRFTGTTLRLDTGAYRDN